MTSAQVMAVTFERHGQLHYLRAAPGQRYRVGENVLYPTDAGPEVAQVVWAPEHVDVDSSGFPECVGRATAADLERDQRNRRARAEAFTLARQLINDRGLDMKVMAVDLLENSEGADRLVAIYYTAPERVDFGALVPELARGLQARIDLRQIGARDGSTLVGGIGNCGRELCCSTFLRKVEPVAMRLTKLQNLPQNPLQISGACGKLMCCLKYEHPLYVDFAARAPDIGSEVQTSQGPARVLGHQMPADAVVVRQRDGQVRRCPLEEVCSSSKARKERSAVLTKREESQGRHPQADGR